MKKAVLFAVILLIVQFVAGVGTGIAARHADKPGYAVERTRVKALDRLTKKLNLTETQKQDVKTILEGSRLQIASLKNELRQKVSQARQDANSEILAMLTPQQQEIFQKMTAEKKQKDGSGGRRQRHNKE